MAIERTLNCPPGLLFSPDTDADRLAMYRLWADSETRTGEAVAATDQPGVDDTAGRAEPVPRQSAPVGRSARR